MDELDLSAFSPRNEENEHQCINGGQEQYMRLLTWGSSKASQLKMQKAKKTKAYVIHTLAMHRVYKLHKLQ